MIHQYSMYNRRIWQWSIYVRIEMTWIIGQLLNVSVQKRRNNAARWFIIHRGGVCLVTRNNVIRNWNTADARDCTSKVKKLISLATCISYTSCHKSYSFMMLKIYLILFSVKWHCNKMGIKSTSATLLIYSRKYRWKSVAMFVQADNLLDQIFDLNFQTLKITLQWYLFKKVPRSRYTITNTLLLKDYDKI